MNLNFERLVSKVADAVEMVGHKLVNDVAVAIDDLGAAVADKQPVADINIADGLDPEKIAEQVAKVMSAFTKAPQAKPAKEQQDRSERLADWEEELLREAGVTSTERAGTEQGSKERLVETLSSIKTYMETVGYYAEGSEMSANWLVSDLYDHVIDLENREGLPDI